ncbi:armadillo repeat-containing protein 4 [Ananas comosus]|uniref:Armadillo repeat-containing protein 4 n=1 Tax=Ananas comosus TaxID=4615 RepID=A0A6P5GAD2_ANACO|nr:armadillo repeat-containing protein 4 [Ananas comosus]
MDCAPVSESHGSSSCSSSSSSSSSSIDWDEAVHLYIRVVETDGAEKLQAKATLELARLANRARGSSPTLWSAAAYALCHVACSFGCRLAPIIGQSGAIPVVLRLLPDSEYRFRRILLRLLSALVSFDHPNRVILMRSGGLEAILDLVSVCADDTKKYLLEIISALALLREVRRVIANLGGLSYLIEAVSYGKMASRTRAAQALGLLGIARRVRHMLVELGAIRALVGLLKDGDESARLIAGNALGIISSHVDYLRLVAEAGAVPLYVELLQGAEPLGKEIAEDVFCVLAVAEENAALILEHLVRILQSGDENAKAAAADVIWDLSGYTHSVSVVRSSGVIPILVKLLENGNDELKEKASAAIGQLSYEGANREAMAEAGAVDVLIGVLRNDAEELREYAAEALMNFTEDPAYRERASEVLEVPSFVSIRDRLVRIRASDDFMVRSMRLMSVDQLASEPDLT